ncbi:Uncharacterised protein [uncultured archaeon]|nr:Uncharacterised protein [uncultured archaeon]
MITVNLKLSVEFDGPIDNKGTERNFVPNLAILENHKGLKHVTPANSPTTNLTHEKFRQTLNQIGYAQICTGYRSASLRPVQL